MRHGEKAEGDEIVKLVTMWWVLAATAVIRVNAVNAGFSETPYTQYALTLDGQLETIALATGLDGRQAAMAKRVAAYWMHVGPCRGASNDLEAVDLSVIHNPNPRAPYHSAILQMVAVLSTQNLGREPPEAICRFALDMAR
jgi:hypothetical protein